MRKHNALNTVSIHLTHKKISIIGSNGSGKSTFARVACGLVPAFSGEVLVYDTPIKKIKDPWQLVYMTFQIPDNQIIMPSVKEEINFGLSHLTLHKYDVQKKIDYALSILKVKSTQPCHSLSAGKKRMLCLLSILLLEPKTLFLDEPTTFLDIPSKNYILSFLEKMPQQTIFITQDMAIATQSEKIMCFHNGSMYYYGNAKTAIQKYKALW